MTRVATVCLLLLCALAAPFAVAPAQAQADRCPKLVARSPFLTPRAALTLPAAYPAAREVSLTYVGHSTFLIETAGGVSVVTDYNDYVRPATVPRVATMNRAHSTHYSLNPDPGIEHVLKGWREDREAARYDLEIGDLWVGNLPTNIRDWEGGTIRNGNSIFIFRAADLCIAHLGHLHHTLTPEDLGALGRIDVVLAPVDGSYTLDVDGMVEVLKALEAPVVIPMHYFNRGTLERFLQRFASSKYAIERSAGPTLVLSRETLPLTPTVMVLPGN
ncbi:MBL fold metallo-hydrolase [Ancylobacter amanitiformis]|uniref:L-ascorbate metabolism protein UlaG (Beta-lactamase superfamily) n=1 Tax=Ancylobacter amanitiformis TaxID=217069 RepID=A0ABU0LLB5_9HYPH|nr:MBL fold metallo-hydrolase [Ancylobacter amanitiformis]MDQ0509495.1 L-ascorbate metabolism protein UlaG (beta-lactamase superfamily) [Ancylobacter amanitiformis]